MRHLGGTLAVVKIADELVFIERSDGSWGSIEAVSADADHFHCWSDANGTLHLLYAANAMPRPIAFEDSGFDIELNSCKTLEEANEELDKKMQPFREDLADAIRYALNDEMKKNEISHILLGEKPTPLIDRVIMFLHPCGWAKYF